MAQIVTSENIMEKFDKLYAEMAVSSDVEDMKLFGRVMREAMEVLAERMPEKAEGLLEELCAIEWDNYLTQNEAENIVANMEPAPKWSKEQVRRGLASLGRVMEEMPYYNECALYVTISMIMSDSGETLKELIADEKGNYDDMKLLNVCYKLAIDKLKDKDGVFNVRRYFSLQ